MTELAQSFPSLGGAPGVDPFDAEELDRWAAGPVSNGERASAQFILAVWDSSIAWEAGRFDVMEAPRTSPSSHREPFSRWALDPWWP